MGTSNSTLTGTRPERKTAEKAKGIHPLDALEKEWEREYENRETAEQSELVASEVIEEAEMVLGKDSSSQEISDSSLGYSSENLSSSFPASGRLSFQEEAQSTTSSTVAVTEVVANTAQTLEKVAETGLGFIGEQAPDVWHSFTDLVGQIAKPGGVESAYKGPALQSSTESVSLQQAKEAESVRKGKEAQARLKHAQETIERSMASQRREAQITQQKEEIRLGAAGASNEEIAKDVKVNPTYKLVRTAYHLLSRWFKKMDDAVAAKKAQAKQTFLSVSRGRNGKFDQNKIAEGGSMLSAAGGNVG